MEPSTKTNTPPLEDANLARLSRPTAEAPLVVHSSVKGSAVEFDPAPLSRPAGQA